MAKDKQKKMMIIGVLVLVVLLVGPAIFQANLLTGYGGMTAQIINVEDSYDLYGTDASAHKFDDNIRIYGTSASVDPAVAGFWPLVNNPTGIRMELTSRLRPVDAATVNLGDIERPIYTDGVETGNERISVRIVPMMMGVTVRTFGEGADAIRGIKFTIRIEENDMNFFESADETIAYLLAVYLVDPIATTSAQSMQLDPSTGGADVNAQMVGENPVPDWVNQAAGEIDYHIPATASAVDAFFTVVNAQPTWPLFGARTENEGTWSVGVDVLIFGHWVVEGELPDFEPQDTPNAWDELLLALGDMFGAIGIGLVAIIIIIILIIIIMMIRIMNNSKAAPASGKRGYIDRKILR